MRSNQRKNADVFSVPNKLTQSKTVVALNIIATTADKTLIKDRPLR